MLVKDGRRAKLVEWGRPAATVEIITHQSPEKVAPHGVWFEARVIGSMVPAQAAGKVYDPHFHDLHYTWDFGEAGPFRTPLRGPAEWHDKGRAYGQYCQHVFGTPGSYTVTCTVRNRVGILAQSSVTITVANPNELFAGDKTITVARDGNFSGAPAGARQAATMAAALSIARSSGQKMRVLLKRGEDYTSEGRPQIETRFGYQNLYLSAWGSGAAPKLTGIWMVHANGGGMLIHDLDFHAGWDPTTETGGGDNSIYTFGGNGHMTVYQCTSSGQGISIYPVQNSVTSVFIVQDCQVTNWRNFACLLATLGRVGLRGCSILQNPLALGGGRGKDDLHNMHGPIRWSGDDGESIGYFSQLDLFSNTGWSQVTHPTLGSLPGHQACFRTSGGYPEHRVMMDRIVAEGGLNNMVLSDTADGAYSRPMNILIDKALLVGTAATTNNLALRFGGSVVRNVVTIQPNSNSMIRSGWQAACGVNERTDPDDPTNVLEPVRIYGNSFVSLLAGANAASARSKLANIGTDYQAAFIGNNVAMALDHVRIHNDGPVAGDVLFTPRFASHQWELAPTPDSSFATPLGTIRLPVPQPGSPVIGTADPRDPVPVDDFFGRLRPVSGPSRGAIEPTP